MRDMKTSGSTSNKILIIIAIIFLGGITSVNAQIDGLPGDGTVEDTPAAPVDGFLGIGLIAAAAIGLRRKLKQ